MSHPRTVWSWMIVATLIGVPLMYVASFGPACWITSRTGSGASLLPAVYAPVLTVQQRIPGAAQLLWSYAELAAADGWSWVEIPFIAHVDPSTGLFVVTELRSSWSWGEVGVPVNIP